MGILAVPAWRIRVALAVALGMGGGAVRASAQTVVNLTNMDPTAATRFTAGTPGTINAPTNLDLVNTATAFSAGGLFGGAVTAAGQIAVNRLNTIGVTTTGGIDPVLLGGAAQVGGGPAMVTINAITSAYPAVGGGGVAASSTTIANTNAAISGGVDQIVGAPAGSNPLYYGGYGGTAGNVSAGSSQSGLNAVNGVGVTLAEGTSLTLSQLAAAPGGAAGLPLVPGGALNMSVINSQLGYTSGGSAMVTRPGMVQSAQNMFNQATLLAPDVAVAVQQSADGLNPTDTTLQSINRALAFSAGAIPGSVAAGVANLAQTGAVQINALALSSGPSATVSGTQAMGTGATGAPQSILSNQVVASTLSPGGFTADADAGWTGFSRSLASGGMPSPTAYASTPLVGLPGAGSAPIGAVNVMGGALYGSGSVSVGNVSQALAQNANAVTVGAANLNFGPAGFSQLIGDALLVTPSLPNTIGGSGGQNNVLAETGIGQSSVAGIGQAFTAGFNTLAVTGHATGALSQSANTVNFGGGTFGPQVTGLSPVATPNAGATGGEGLPGATSAGPYAIYPSGYPFEATPTWNTATAVTAYGAGSASGVTQTMDAAINSFGAVGQISSGSAGTVSQSVGVLAVSCGCTAGQGAPAGQQITVQSTNQGTVTASNLTQGLSVQGNTIQSGSGVAGSVAQSAMSATMGGAAANAFNPSNAILVTSNGQGSGALNGTTQRNAVMLNSVATNGDLGTAGNVASFSQATGGAGANVGTSDHALGAAGTPLAFGVAFAVPWNSSTVIATSGAGASAAANDGTQSASLMTNQMVGGAMVGAVTQTATGQHAAIGNSVTAYAVGSPAGPPNLSQPLIGSTVQAASPAAGIGTDGMGASGVMSGNSTLTGQVQAAGQGLNVMRLGGALNGLMNQAVFGGAMQVTGNQAIAQANTGFAVATGAQVTQNAINTISSR